MNFDLNDALQEDDGGAQHGHPFDLNMEYEDGDIEHASDDDLDVYADHVDIVFEEDELPESDDEQGNIEQGVQEQNGHVRQRDHLTDDQRNQVYIALLEKSTNMKLKKDTTTIVADMFGIKVPLVQSIWRKVKQCHALGVPVDLRSKKINCARPKVNVNLAMITTIPLNERTTIRGLASKLGVCKSTLHRIFQEGKIRRHSNSLKPYLKEENKISRLKFCVSMIDPATLQNEPRFGDMSNIVHIDEKWFNTTSKNRRFYMLPEERDPLRTVHNKNSIDKVMFLAALARPRYDAEGNCTFDGKIGVWPFIKKEPAKRKSQNRARGTLITKSINVNRDTMREFLISKVLPALVAAWPGEDVGKTIWIQQDNARTHVPASDEPFANAVAQSGLDIRIMHQPANSPDMNVLDLGYFASLQTLTYRINARSMDDLIENVAHEYAVYDPAKVNRVFLTLQSCLIEVMKARGGNGYKIPHMNKEDLELAGNLPITLQCARSLYDSVIQHLNE